MSNTVPSITSLPDPGERYTLEDEIAAGIEATVYQAIDHKSAGKKVAIKIQKLRPDNQDYVQEEYRILKEQNDHPNLPTFYGGYKKDEEIWFVMELCEGGSVLDLVHGLQEKTRRMAEEHIAFILKETVKALTHLHKGNTIHGDVSAANILITTSGEIKLCDFNLSRDLASSLGKRSSCVGSVSWMAPEVVSAAQSGQGYGSRADVWALGITAIELGDGQTPFHEMHPTRAMFQIVRNPPPKLIRPSNWSENYNDFIAECLEKNPEYRPYMVELLEHPFLSSIPENSHYLTMELKKLLEDLGITGKTERKPEPTIRSNLLKTSQNSDPERMFLEDLAAMENLSEDLILFELEERMVMGHFHTFIGDILLILNPNEKQDIYGNSHHNKYHLKSQSENPPHIYSIADRAYQDVLHHEIPQYILLSGESGSGKTTNRRHLIDHLIFVGKSGNKNGQLIQEGLNILEALVSASTTTNVDSTRCITKTEVTYGPSGKVTGAVFNIYQLEKWRISSTDMNQANFHAIYYFYDYLNSTGNLNKYSLDPDRKYRYLRVADNPENSAETRYNPEDNAKKFTEIFKNTQIIDQEQLEVICKTISAILNLGEVCFEENEAGIAEIENSEYCDRVAELLSIENKKFSWALTNYCLVEKGTAFRMKNDVDQARDSRDMLACCLYFRLVDWIANIINYQLSKCRAVYGDKYTISIIDMFGFECFERNDLEQLLVNTINEQMQYHYIQRVFAWEILEQIEEDIPPLNLNYYDNKLAVDQLLGKPTGILSLIDECSRSGHSYQHILDTIKKSGNNLYVQTTSSKEFSVAHFTGKVNYDIREMPHKNRDFLPPDLVETLRMSSNPCIREFFAGKLSKTGNLILSNEHLKEVNIKSKWSNALIAEHEKLTKPKLGPENQYSQTRRMRTALATYRACALELLRELSVGGGAGGTHFIRCVRSDLVGTPRAFHKELIKHQLRALAVLDTAISRQNGFPHRIGFSEFLRRYKFLAFDFEENVDITKDNCRLLMVRLKMEGWLIGKNKVFLKYYNEEYLARLYETQVKKIVKVQSMMRAFLAKRNFASKLKSIKDKKAGAKLVRQQSDLGTEAAAALMIQKAYRGHVARKKYGPLINKESGQIDKETAEFLKPFAKKWRNKSMFQVLLQYRAAKFQDYVNFSQQIHIFNQNAFHESQKINDEVDLDKIDTSAAVDSWLGGKKLTVSKMPFTFGALPYYETQRMCEPSSGLTTDEDQDAWDSPLKWRQSIILEMRKKDYNTQRPKTPLFQKQKISEEHLISVPYHRDPSQTLKKLLDVPDNEKIRPRSSSQTSLREEKFVKTEIAPSYLKKSTHFNVSPKHSADRNFEGANQDFEFIRSSPKSKLRKTGNPIEELESIGKKNFNRINEDDPPFNFQGMLRKTNFKRDSMKKIDENFEEGPYNRNLRPKIYHEDSNKNEKIRYEVAPGIFLEGTEAEI